MRLPSSASIRPRRSFVHARVPCRIGRTGGRAAVDVLAVLDGEILQVAEPGVDAAQRLVGIRCALDASLARQAAALRRLDDQLRQTLAPAAIEAVGLRVFVDQPFELARVAGQIRADERRRQMAERHARRCRRLACAASPGLLTMNG